MLVYFAALVALVAACLFFYATRLLWVFPVSFAATFIATALLIFLFICIACAFVDMSQPASDSTFYRMMMILVAQSIPLILRMRFKKEGLEKLPKEGRYLVVCNHLSDLDPVCLHAAFPKSHLAFISKRENSSMFLVGKIMHKTLCQMINRENDREALKTILACIGILKEDRANIAVFPEGYTSVDGKLHPFRHGVFKIAQKAQVPVVVCCLKGTDHVFRNFLHLKPTKVSLSLLDVIYPEDFAGKTTVDLGTQVHNMMAAHLGPDLVLQEQGG